MRPEPRVPPVRDLLLVGGGHSHVEVLRRIAMRAIDGVRVTLIARELHTPYSGMLPGLIAGHYVYDEAHIDLGRLANAAGVRLIEGEVAALDPVQRIVRLSGRPDLRYDVLSLNCGAVPGTSGVVCDTPVVPVKPIGQFLVHWERVLHAVTCATANGHKTRLAIVGGGAGGVELALAIDHALRQRLATFELALVHAEDTLLPGHPAPVRRRLMRILRERRVTVHPAFRVVKVDAAGVHAADQMSAAVDPISAAADRLEVSADHVLWVTGVEAPAWPAQAGLATDLGGFVLVDAALRSVSHREVYAAGDVAALDHQQRPKSGVYAVREGPVLAENLRRAFSGGTPRRFRAQRRALALISEGGRSATASRGFIAPYGKLMWRWKDQIDRRFMARFDLQPMSPVLDTAALSAAMAADLPDPMRCGGCAAKLSSGLLHRVLQRLDIKPHPDVIEGIGDDAAVFAPSASALVVSVDSLRALTDDPHRFGRIAAEHALSDVFAMGARPVAALALVTLPLMGDAQLEEDLFLLIHGALRALDAQQVVLAGGHSMEGRELAVGFAVTGRLDAEPWRKRGLEPGDALVLTKPLGTGVLFAGAMRGLARSRWLSAALEGMERSNADAVPILRRAGVRACTDVTGFGLVGHLNEMLCASSMTCDLDLAALPAYEGALELLRGSVRSSLHRSNVQALRDVVLPAASDDSGKDGSRTDDSHLALLADPQTSGGLLAGVPAANAEDCVHTLRSHGYPHACIIGRTRETGLESGRIVIGGNRR